MVACPYLPRIFPVSHRSSHAWWSAIAQQKDWTKIGTQIAFVTLIFGMVAYVNSIALTLTFDDAEKYFLITLVLLFGIFVYFQYIKE